MTAEEKKIWDFVHSWCDGLRAEIPDDARRHLMDVILDFHQSYSLQNKVKELEEENQRLNDLLQKGEVEQLRMSNALNIGRKWDS